MKIKTANNVEFIVSDVTATIVDPSTCRILVQINFIGETISLEDIATEYNNGGFASFIVLDDTGNEVKTYNGYTIFSNLTERIDNGSVPYIVLNLANLPAISSVAEYGM